MKGLTHSFRALAQRATSAFLPFRNAFSVLVSGFLSGSSQNWKAKAGKVYDNSVVAAAIEYLSGGIDAGPRLVVERPIRGTKGREWLEVDDHFLPSVVESGVVMTASQLYAGVVISLVTSGNAYWLKIRNNSGVLIGFAYLAHYRVTPMGDKDFGDRQAGAFPITYYQIDDREIDPTEIVHFRWGMDPDRPGCGKSPIDASLREVCTDNEASTLTQTLLERGGVLGQVLSPSSPPAESRRVATPSPGQMNETAAIIRMSMTGDSATTLIPIPFDLKVQNVGFKPSELALDKQRQMSLERILSPLGIDPMVLGLPSQSKTFSNFEEANEAAVRRALLRILSIVGKELTSQCLLIDFEKRVQRFSSNRVSWDLSEVPALQVDLDLLNQRIRENFKADLITRAEGREELGYTWDTEDDRYHSEIMREGKPSPEDDDKEANKGDRSLKRRARRLAVIYNARVGQSAVLLGLKGESKRSLKVPDQDAFESMIFRLRKEMLSLTEIFKSGEIDALTWADRFNAILLEGHSEAALKGRELAKQKGLKVDLVDILRGQAATDAEANNISRFLDALLGQDPRYWDDAAQAWDLAAIHRRQSLYLAPMRGTANQAFLEESADDVEIHWIDTGSPNECDECREYAAMSPFKKDELPTVPGSRDTPCDAGCECYLRVGEIEGFKRVDF